MTPIATLRGDSSSVGSMLPRLDKLHIFGTSVFGFRCAGAWFQMEQSEQSVVVSVFENLQKLVAKPAKQGEIR